jgi:hypothetical protein
MLSGCSPKEADRSTELVVEQPTVVNPQPAPIQKLFFSDSSPDVIKLSEGWSISFKDQGAYALKYENEIKSGSFSITSRPNSDLSNGWVFYADTEALVFLVGIDQYVLYEYYSSLDPVVSRSGRFHGREIAEQADIPDEFKVAYQGFLARN